MTTVGATSDPLEAVGFISTKAGRGDKEPAYTITKTRLFKLFGMLALLLLAISGYMVYNGIHVSAQFKKLTSALDTEKAKELANLQKLKITEKLVGMLIAKDAAYASGNKDLLGQFNMTSHLLAGLNVSNGNQTLAERLRKRHDEIRKELSEEADKMIPKSLPQEAKDSFKEMLTGESSKKKVFNLLRGLKKPSTTAAP